MNSDMCLMPDPASACIDPFFAETTLVLVCNVLEPTTGEPYNRDPRGIASKAAAMVKSMGVGDTVYFGPEAEFFVFDDVRYNAEPYNTGFRVDRSRCPINSWTEYEGGNLGHRIRTKVGVFPRAAAGSIQDMRSEMLAAMAKMGVKVEKHHHEVASAQHELGMKFAPLVDMADHLQIYKYCIHQVAQIYGKTAMLHAEADLWRQRLRHACATSRSGRTASRYSPATNMLTCRKSACTTSPASSSTPRRSTPSPIRPTNSYKRLVPGFEAPVLLAYSARNRSASCRIPWTNSPKAKRVEVRFPDPLANPYLGFAAMLMAGLDGIKKRLDPGAAMDKDLYDLRRRS